MSKSLTKLPLHNARVLGLFYSITLKEAQILFSFDLRSHHNSRATILVLIHISVYKKSLISTLANLYHISYRTLLFILDRLLNAGLIKTVSDKRRTNIDKLVKVTAYNITVEGMQTVRRINDMLDNKLANVKPLY